MRKAETALGCSVFLVRSFQKGVAYLPSLQVTSAIRSAVRPRRALLYPKATVLKGFAIQTLRSTLLRTSVPDGPPERRWFFNDVLSYGGARKAVEILLRRFDAATGGSMGQAARFVSSDMVASALTGLLLADEGAQENVAVPRSFKAFDVEGSGLNAHARVLVPLLEIDATALADALDSAGGGWADEPEVRRAERKLRKAIASGSVSEHLAARRTFERDGMRGSILEFQWYERAEKFEGLEEFLCEIGDSITVAGWASDATSGWRVLCDWAIRRAKGNREAAMAKED
ncbi:MAG: hypothetical protein HY900_04305 [Deltaproteobacteria bacterium]|nr:hypothetical protein [Deltaproteobacteria bacterium]